ILIRCNAGCTTDEVCDRLDHAVTDLFFDGDEPWIGADGALDDVAGVHDAADSVHGDVASAQGAGGPPDSSTVTVAGPPAADEGLRHAAYTGLLERLELSTAHFDNLRNRGLAADEIAKRGYRTADAGKVRKAVDELLTQHGAERLLTVPGFAEK